ncbi:hypothetical protein [Granulicella mallensis]|nr:hypothetical protein [Granulicella mallensis]
MMIDALFVVSIAINVLLIVLWPKETAKIVPAEDMVLEASKPVSIPKPFRARKAFREVKRQFEDAHDPRRISMRQVERFVQKAKEKRDDR